MTLLLADLHNVDTFLYMWQGLSQFEGRCMLAEIKKGQAFKVFGINSTEHKQWKWKRTDVGVLDGAASITSHLTQVPAKNETMHLKCVSLKWNICFFRNHLQLIQVYYSRLPWCEPLGLHAISKMCNFFFHVLPHSMTSRQTPSSRLCVQWQGRDGQRSHTTN